MNLVQETKNFDMNPLIRLSENASEAEIQTAKFDCLNLINYLSWVLSDDEPLPEFGVYFTTRNEFQDKKVLFTRSIYQYLKTFDPLAPENKEITENLSDILDFFGTDKKLEIFGIMANKFNIRINVEAALAQAIVEPQIKFDHNNIYKRVWHKLLQDQIFNKSNEQSR